MEFTLASVPGGDTQIRDDTSDGFQRRAVFRIVHFQCKIVPVYQYREIVPRPWRGGRREENVQRVVQDFERMCIGYRERPGRVRERGSYYAVKLNLGRRPSTTDLVVTRRHETRR